MANLAVNEWKSSWRSVSGEERTSQIEVNATGWQMTVIVTLIKQTSIAKSRGQYS